MDVTYHRATEELKASYAHYSQTNAHAFIALDNGHFSVVAMCGSFPVGLIAS